MRKTSGLLVNHNTDMHAPKNGMTKPSSSSMHSSERMSAAPEGMSEGLANRPVDTLSFIAHHILYAWINIDYSW